MDWMTFTSNVLKFVSDIVSALAWPGLVVFLLWRFRAEIKPLIGEIKPLFGKLTSLKVGALEAKFALGTEQVLGDIQAAPTQPVPAHPPAQLSVPTVPEESHLPGGTQHRNLDAESTMMNEVVEDDWPTSLQLSGVGEDASTLRNSAIVAMAWRDVEGAINTLAKALSPRVRFAGRPGIAAKLKAIEMAQLLQPRFLQALKALQKLRNEVIHTPGFEPTDESTRKYLEGVRSARMVLEEATLDARKWEQTPWGDPLPDQPGG